MRYEASSPDEYINEIPEERKAVIAQLRKVILESLPEGFEETMGYGMIGYVVPHTLYPAGYHCNPKEPLPFMGIASQKNFVAVYHMGVYADQELLNWFVQEYPKHMKTKLDMGKSCIRFKKMDQIPYALIGELCKKITVEQWIEKCER
ncbi:DUF1801 domain-containing protein [Paenibacillus glacialis]|uniref:YdhG-like domain-containing protein n=1 Tax=Paenibacillus glacialis TaxID=494026 RepID=A0A168FBB7_9BACL|nr:DUF1801 domain-containing protein [Paenibacillus glacialis]OAB36042.1 hypothetical protein PGLA_21730 [Paenibacillus glacialis]